MFVVIKSRNVNLFLLVIAAD